MPVPPSKENTLWRVLAGLLWLCFVLKGAFYCSVLPLWEGYDEFSHFAYLQKLAVDRELPKPDTDTTREVIASLSCAPLPWTIREDLPDLPHVVHDEFWLLPAAEREQRMRCLQQLEPERRGESAPMHRRLYESQQPPPYYLLLTPLYLIVQHTSLTTRVLCLRLASLLLASLLVPLTFIAGTYVFPERWMALGSACILATLPELFVSVCRVSNEALAVVAGSLLTIAILWWSRREDLRATCWLAIGLGGALLVKAYFLSVLLAVVLLILLRALQRRNWVDAVKRGATVAAIVLLIAGWWYGRTWHLTGSVSGEQLDALSQSIPLFTRLRAVGQVHWLGTLDSALLTHFWFGGWSFLRFRQAWIYHVLTLIWFLAFVGAIAIVVRRLDGVARRKETICLVTLFACLAVTLAYHALASFLVVGVAATEGWYIYCLASAECILLLAGLTVLCPWPWRPVCVPGVVLLLSAADLFGMHFYLLPYYTGVIRHAPTGTVPPMHLVQFTSVGFGELFSRLAINKASFETAPVLVSLWILYLLGMAGTAGIACMVYRSGRLKAA